MNTLRCAIPQMGDRSPSVDSVSLFPKEASGQTLLFALRVLEIV